MQGPLPKPQPSLTKHESGPAGVERGRGSLPRAFPRGSPTDTPPSPLRVASAGPSRGHPSPFTLLYPTGCARRSPRARMCGEIRKNEKSKSGPWVVDSASPASSPCSTGGIASFPDGTTGGGWRLRAASTPTQFHSLRGWAKELKRGDLTPPNTDVRTPPRPS